MRPQPAGARPAGRARALDPAWIAAAGGV